MNSKHHKRDAFLMAIQLLMVKTKMEYIDAFHVMFVLTHTHTHTHTHTYTHTHTHTHTPTHTHTHTHTHIHTHLPTFLQITLFRQ